MKNVKQDWAAAREAVRGLQRTLDRVERALAGKAEPEMPEAFADIFKGFGSAKAKQGG